MSFSTPSAFGSSNTGGSAFGGFSTANNNQSTPAPSLFGSTTTNQATPSNNIFAAAANNANGANTTGTGAQASQPTTSIFGTAPAANTTTTTDNNAPKSIFGSSTGTTGGIFGNSSANTAQTSTTPSLFGSTSANTTQPATGGLFGSTNTTATQPTAGASAFGTGTGSLFGSASNNTGGSSIFGGGNSASAFGNTGTSAFGTTTAAAPSTSLFGNTQQQQQHQNSASSLSQSALFGRPNATGMYASTLSVPHSLAPALGASVLGSGGLLKGRGTVVSAPGAPPDPAAQFAQLSAKIEGIQRAWDSRSPDCRFQYAFYNLVDPNQVNMYGRPPNATNDALWVKAVHENPDPSCLVPVIATGFDDLQARVDAQVQTAQLHQQKLADLKTRLTALSERHSLSNVSRHQRAAQTQMQLAYRISKLCSHLHLLIPALRASAIRPEEEALRAALDSLSFEIRGPGASNAGVHHMGRLRARLNELWALLGAAQAAHERGKGKDARWAVVDEDGLREIAQILGDQQTGLAHLTRLLQKDLRDLAIIEGTESRDPETGRVASPVSALASSMGRHAVR